MSQEELNGQQGKSDEYASAKTVTTGVKIPAELHEAYKAEAIRLKLSVRDYYAEVILSGRTAIKREAFRRHVFHTYSRIVHEFQALTTKIVQMPEDQSFDTVAYVEATCRLAASMDALAKAICQQFHDRK